MDKNISIDSSFNCYWIEFHRVEFWKDKKTHKFKGLKLTTFWKVEIYVKRINIRKQKEKNNLKYLVFILFYNSQNKIISVIF